MKRSPNRSRRGLTLLELMIVLIILVGLIALVGPRLLGSQKKADIRTAQVQIGNLVSALKMYAVDMKTYPSTEDGLQMLIKGPEDERLARNWSGPYIEGSKLPIDPWGNDFQYEFGTEEGSSDFPRIFSMGPDGQAGNEDDIANQAAAGEEESDSNSESPASDTSSSKAAE
jgi:general secretion pathway protein G